MGRTTATTKGLTLEYLFDYLGEDSTVDLDSHFLRELALGECSRLNPREQEALNGRFWSGMTYKALAEKFQLSTERVRQIEAKALRKVRKHLLDVDPILAAEHREHKKKVAAQRAEEWEREEQKKLDEQLEREKDLPCPDYLFLKRGHDGELCLELPLEYASQFKPIMTATYNRWLEEKSKDPQALKELEEDEMEFGKAENQGAQ